MTERESTGISKLDSLLEGGIPAGSTVILKGPPGSGKSIFCSQFLNRGLESGQGGLFITLDNAPDEIREEAADFGWNFQKKDNFLVMDVYSWQLGEEIENDYAVQGPSDLNQLNMTLSDALKDIGDVKKRIAIDSASTLTFYTDTNSTVKFLQVVSAKSQANNGVLLLTVEEGVHDEKTISTLNYVADGVIEFKKNDNMYLKVPRMSKTKPSDEKIEFSITDTGLESN